MRATILHETNTRMRIHIERPRMTCNQADLLQSWLEYKPWAKTVDVHERTCCVIIHYRHGQRQDVLDSIREFSWDSAS